MAVARQCRETTAACRCPYGLFPYYGYCYYLYYLYYLYYYYYYHYYYCYYHYKLLQMYYTPPPATAYYHLVPHTATIAVIEINQLLHSKSVTHSHT